MITCLSQLYPSYFLWCSWAWQVPCLSKLERYVCSFSSLITRKLKKKQFPRTGLDLSKEKRAAPNTELCSEPLRCFEEQTKAADEGSEELCGGGPGAGCSLVSRTGANPEHVHPPRSQPDQSRIRNASRLQQKCVEAWRSLHPAGAQHLGRATQGHVPNERLTVLVSSGSRHAAVTLMLPDLR